MKLSKYNFCRLDIPNELATERYNEIITNLNV